MLSNINQILVYKYFILLSVNFSSAMAFHTFFFELGLTKTFFCRKSVPFFAIFKGTTCHY